MMDEFDVIVIGGGIAGLSTAVQCAKEGIKTLLVDKREIPSDRYSMVAFSTKGRRLLKKEGIDLAQVGNKIEKYLIRFQFDDREAGLPLELTNPCFGYCVTDTQVGSYILNRTDNLKIKKGTVVGAKRKEGGVEIKLDNSEILKCKIIVDATGPTKNISRMLGRPWNPRYVWTYMGNIIKDVDPKMFGIDTNLVKNNLFSIKHGIQSYDLVIEPVNETTISFTSYVLTNLRRKNILPQNPDTNIDIGELCKSTVATKHHQMQSKYKDAIERGKEKTSYFGIITDRVEKDPPYGDNLILVGHSARQAPFCWAEGVVPFLLYGIFAGEVIADAITDEDYSKSYLRSYGKMVDKNPLDNMDVWKFGAPKFLLEGGRFPNVLDIVDELFQNDLGEESVRVFWNLLTSVGDNSILDYAANIPQLLTLLKRVMQNKRCIKDLLKAPWMEILTT